MSTNRSVGRITPIQEKDRSAVKPKKARSTNLCAFTSADGRQCRTPRRSGHLHLCYFHAQKEAESLAAQQVGEDISRFLPTKLLTACDLGVALARTFCAVARGDLKPKVASTLAYLAQTMLQSIPIAQHEYIESFNTNTWRNAVRASFRYEDEANTSAPQPAPRPPASSASAPPTPVEAGLQPGSSASSSTSSQTPQPSARPAPKPHTPLPPTINEFFQQVEAGLNSSRSEVSTVPGSEIPAPSGSETPTRSGPDREPSSSGSSSSCTPTSVSSSSDSAPDRTPSRQSAPSSPCILPTQPAPAPPTPPSASAQQSPTTQNSQNNSVPAPAPQTPPPVPPGFGAPANWDVLIPPKRRRRFSRHWQLPE
jgi:hypothetical protein